MIKSCKDLNMKTTTNTTNTTKATNSQNYKSYQGDASLMPLTSMGERWIALLNKQFFNGKLPQITLTVQPDARGSKVQSYGWATTNQVWHNANTNKAYHEINLTATSLENRDVMDIIGTLLHELVHIYNAINEIKDTSSNGHFHNAKFKTACENHGLICEKTDKYGWSETSFTDEARSYICKTITDTDKKAVALFRDQQAKKVSKTRKLYVYQCPCCGVKIRASKEVHLICSDCNEPFVLVDGPNMDNDQ